MNTQKTARLLTLLSGMAMITMTAAQAACVQSRGAASAQKRLLFDGPHCF